MMRRLRHLAAGAVVAALLGAAIRPADAESAIQQLIAKTPAPAPGSVATIEVAISPADHTTWEAKSYLVAIVVSDPNGTVLATSDPVIGDEAAVPGASTIVFVNVTIPGGASGALNVSARLTHGTYVETSTPVALAVSAVPSVPIATQARPPSGKSPFSGTLTSNEAFAAQQSQSGLLNLSGKYGNGQSFTTSAGLSSTPGGAKPIIGFQTANVLTQIGSFAPSFDRDVYSGASGTGFSVKRTWGDTHSLQLAYISGNHSTTNPFEMEGAQYAFPILGSPFELTGGYENVYGPSTEGAFFLRDGTFVGAGYDVRAPHSSLVYGAHFGFVHYNDALTNTERSDDVIDLNLGFNVRKAQVALTYVRAGAYYANASAPGITPDREAAGINVSAPVGVFQVSAGANGYRDQLPGSTLQQQTHFYTEAASVSYAFHNGDALQVQATNAIQHQTGTPVAPFSGNDNTGITYTTKRGPYQFQYSLTDTEQRDNGGHLMHVVVDGFSISRAPFAGFTISTGFNLTNNQSNEAAQTGLSNSANATVSYDTGPFTLSTQVNHAISHPFVGLSTPATTTYNYGITLKPGRRPYSLTASVTQNVGVQNSANGALALSRQF